MTLALPLQSKNEAKKYGLINKCTYETKQAESGTGKRERMSIESADMEKIEHDIQSKPTEAACRR